MVEVEYDVDSKNQSTGRRLALKAPSNSNRRVSLHEVNESGE